MVEHFGCKQYKHELGLVVGEMVAMLMHSGGVHMTATIYTHIEYSVEAAVER